MVKLKGEEDTVVQMYNNGATIFDIATEYGVNNTTIHRLLHKNGVLTPRREYTTSRKKYTVGNRESKYKMKERVFSPEFLAKQKENTRINDEHIQYIKFENTTEDQKLVVNILSRPIVG